VITGGLAFGAAGGLGQAVSVVNGFPRDLDLSTSANNFDQHLESLHSGGLARRQDGCLGFNNGLGVMIGDSAQVDPRTQRDQQMGGSGPLPTISYWTAPATPSGGEASKAGGAASPTSSGGASCLPTTGPFSRLNLWTGGLIDFGMHSIGSVHSGFRFQTDGISLGVDYSYSETLTFGAGLGYGQDGSKIGRNGTRADSTDYDGAVYADYRLGKDGFIDAVLGYGQLRFTSRRYITATGGLAFGDRDGREGFTSLSAGWTWTVRHWSLSPYGRLNAIDGTLGGFTENPGVDTVYGLTFASQPISALNSVAGLRGERVFATTFGAAALHFRTEYQHDFAGAGLADLAYSNWVGGPTYVVAVDATHRDHVMMGFGGDLKVSQTRIGLDYKADVSGGQKPENEITGRIATTF
jgi:uncharacterized protein YhjY with autotransporter beta-barrel domain